MPSTRLSASRTTAKASGRRSSKLSPWAKRSLNSCVLFFNSRLLRPAISSARTLISLSISLTGRIGFSCLNMFFSCFFQFQAVEIQLFDPSTQERNTIGIGIMRVNKGHVGTFFNKLFDFIVITVQKADFQKD